MRDLSSKLRNKAFESFLWRILGMIALFSMHAMLGRKLSPDKYGLYSFTMSIVMVLVLLATMGWPSALLRVIPQYMVNQQWPLLKGVLLRSHQLSLGIAVFFSILLLYASFQIDDAQRSTALYFAGLLLPIRSLVILRQSVFRGLHNVKGSILPDEVLLPVLMVAGLFIFGSVSIETVIFLYLSIACVLLVSTWGWLWDFLKPKLGITPPEFELKAWIHLAFPLLVGGVSQVILGQSGVFLLGMFGDMAGAGFFSASFRFALFVTFGMTAINIIGMPMMSAALHNNDISGLMILKKKSQNWSFFGALPVFFCLFLLPDIALSLFGNGFKDAAFLLRILVLGQLVNAAVGLAGSILAVAGEEQFYMKSLLVTMFLCVGGMLLAIPIWGATGAACTYSASLIFLSVLQLYKSNRLLARLGSLSA